MLPVLHLEITFGETEQERAIREAARIVNVAWQVNARLTWTKDDSIPLHQTDSAVGVFDAGVGVDLHLAVLDAVDDPAAPVIMWRTIKPRVLHVSQEHEAMLRISDELFAGGLVPVQRCQPILSLGCL
jgi:hypothetical protein